MAPGINLLRKSLRQDRGGYESKPTNASTVSSLTCSIVHDSPREMDVVKRSVSLDRTLDTEIESSDLNSFNGSILPIRRLGSSDNSRSNESISRKCSIQDEVMKDEKAESIDTSISSITLESDIRLYHKNKSKSFHDTRSVPYVGRSRSRSRNRRTISVTAHSLERIREESSRFTAVTTAGSSSQFTEKEPESLTLTELEMDSNESKERPSNYVGKRDKAAPYSYASHSRESYDPNNSSRSNLSSHKKQSLKRIISRGDQSTASTESYVSTETLELISSLHEANVENESIISKLEHELSALVNERDALQISSEEMVRAMKEHETELQAQLKRERKGFANASSAHKKEVKVWMDKASSLSTKVLDLEQEAKTRDVADEVRAEKIVNLEKNMAKLYELYSGKNSEEGMDDQEQSDVSVVEKSLCAYDSIHYESQKWKDRYNQLQRSYDEVVGRNTRQCDEMQSEIDQLKASLQKLEEENQLIRANSVESSGSYNEDLLNKICDLVDENTSLTEKCQEFDALKEEHNTLQESLIEAKSFADAAQKSINDLKSENAALEEELELERNACEYLRQESCQSECLDEMREENELLSAELREKNDAMKLIKDAMESLKADQQSIKETVVKLRMENLRLKDEKEEAVKAKRPPPPPPHPSYLKEKADLEARLERIEEENSDLKETNQGLATRICKLVDFIKEMKDFDQGKS